MLWEFKNTHRDEISKVETRKYFKNLSESFFGIFFVGGGGVLFLNMFRKTIILVMF